MKTLLKLSIASIIVVGGACLYASDDEHEVHEHHRSAVASKPMTPKEKSSAALYTKECGSCHMAYQPQFLPKRSWEKTMKMFRITLIQKRKKQKNQRNLLTKIPWNCGNKIYRFMKLQNTES